MTQITNTHLKTHGITTDEYKSQFPGSKTFDENFLRLKSENMKGKNKGNLRPDAKLRMENDNPMKNSEIAKTVGEKRKEAIVNGIYPALDYLGHLPTEKEKLVQRIFDKLGIPLIYVGDGQKWIGGKCPDFINEELKIILELDLNMIRDYKQRDNLEQTYSNEGYRTIWLTTVEEEEIKQWVLPFFNGEFKWRKIKRIIKTEKKKRQVYNLEVEPHNTYVANRIAVHNCYADTFRASLYTSFFDNPRSIGIRHCNPDYYKAELDKLFQYRGKRVENADEKVKAISLDIPMRFGIRFEDFLPVEANRGISLNMLQYLSENAYPVMINTKSDLVGREKYVKALANNPAGAAVHLTMISSDDKLNKDLEPGAPPFQKRLWACKQLISAGVRVVARIEPFMVFINDEPDYVHEYLESIQEAGIKHVTFDTYSYSARNPTIKSAFLRKGYDFDRMFLLMSECQWLGSLLLGKFMDLFRERGIKCSTFDMGNVPTNDDPICCNVGDWFQGGWNLGSIVSMVRFIMDSPHPVGWKDYQQYVNENGGFLSQKLEKEVQNLWNIKGNDAYSPDWAPFIQPAGMDSDFNIKWYYNKRVPDYREERIKVYI